ncbi:MAG: reverse transcriptase-like protein [Lachnospiraceae bacterium]|nr:reverse transcriptase-like protein [Lachnospiraceae bacterium]
MTDNDKLIAYVDGSFNPEIGRYAYGCVLIKPTGEIEELCGSGNDPEALKQRNVSGEMIASMLAVRHALKNGYKAVDIYYDYSGIECWVTGAWKAKNDLTQKYRDWMNDKENRLTISFFKVAAHTNDKYNEMADKLAKRGLTKEPGLPD